MKWEGVWLLKGVMVSDEEDEGANLEMGFDWLVYLIARELLVQLVMKQAYHIQLCIIWGKDWPILRLVAG